MLRLRARVRAHRRDLRAVSAARRSPRSTSSGTRSGARRRRAAHSRASARVTRSPTSSCSSTLRSRRRSRRASRSSAAAGQAVLKSLQRLHVDPLAVYGTNCLEVRRPRTRPTQRTGSLASFTSSSRSSSWRWASDCVAFLNDLAFPLSDRLDPQAAGALQRFTPTIEALVAPGYRRGARRGAREDGLLERLQDARPLVGGATAVLSRRRAAALGALLVVLAVYGAIAGHLPRSAVRSRHRVPCRRRLPGVRGRHLARTPARSAAVAAADRTRGRGRSPRPSLSRWSEPTRPPTSPSSACFALAGFWFLTLLRGAVVDRARRGARPVGRHLVRSPPVRTEYVVEERPGIFEHGLDRLPGTRRRRQP